MIKKILSLIIVFFLCLSSGIAQNWVKQTPDTLNSSVQVSILTSAPWSKQIYALFGHSAIRVCDEESNIDWVFNYGIFDFNSPNFIYRFMAGETDYLVAPTNYVSYVAEYERRGIDVYEQVVNLTNDEKQQIWQFLVNNSRIENRVYRYNIFFNNCTTKLTEILENNIKGKVIYPEDNEPSTFRTLVHEFVHEKPWVMFGIDIIIGSGADTLIGGKEKMFLPQYQMNKFNGSFIEVGCDSIKGLVTSCEKIIVADRYGLESDDSDTIFTPMVVGFILLIVSVLVSLYDFKKKKRLASLYDTILFLVAGLAGFIVFFMMFFSVHPCTSDNWNLVWLNPLQLVAALLFFVKPFAKCIYYYHFINFALLILLLLAWSLVPQQMETAFIPFILAIALRSGVYAYREYKTNKKS